MVAPKLEEALHECLGRVGGIAKPATLFVQTAEPIEFGAPDAPVRNFYVFTVPADGGPEQHLQLLASVAAKFSNARCRSQLSCVTTAQQVENAFHLA